MAAVGLFLVWSVLLPALLLALYLPTPENSTWHLSLNSAPELSLLEVSSKMSLRRALPAIPHSDSSAHEFSSGDGELKNENRRGASPTGHPGAAISMMQFELPEKGAPASSSGGLLAPHLTEESLVLPTEGFSRVQGEVEDTGSITLEQSPEQGKKEFSLPSSGMSNINMSTLVVASLPTSPRLQASELLVSQEEILPSIHQAGFKHGLPATTLSPRPTVSTIPLATFPVTRSHVRWEAAEGTKPKDNTLRGWPGNKVPEQELLGQNPTTAKYLASYRSRQVYSGLPGQEELSTSPLRHVTQGDTQNLPGQDRDILSMTSTSQEGIVTPLIGKGQNFAHAPASSHPPISDDHFPVSFTPTLSEEPNPHLRSTHWNLIPDTTQQPRLWDMDGMGKTIFHSSSATPGIGEMHDIAEPQRVRGAVNPKVSLPYFGSSTPGQSPSKVQDDPGTKHSGAAWKHPSGQSSTGVSTTSARVLATPRRGLIQVTTQRVMQHPQLPKPDPSRPARPPASSPPCPGLGNTCHQLLPNQTLLRWGELEHTLSFAWGLHVYGSGVLFLLLSLLSLACLGGSLSVHGWHLPHVLAASALLLAFGVLRTTFFLADPYGSRGQLPARAVRLLYTVPFPLLLSTFMVLLLRLLHQARLQVLPPRWQSLPLWAALSSLHSIILLGADLLSPPVHLAVPVGLHTLSCTAGLCLLPATVFVYWLLRHSRGMEGTLEPGLWREAWVLLASSGLALPCCGLQFYGVLWLSGSLGQPDVFTWGWWFVQFWFRIGELALSFILALLAWQALCQHRGATEHSCWAKLLSYFCAYRKAEVPEYPNNCYDWPGGVLEKVPSHNLNNNLIRNSPGGGGGGSLLWALKDSNELRAGAGQGSSPPPRRAGYGPKCPNVAAAAMGRSYTSICFERESVLSLAELEFRPPSPINLSRSIDEALFREHLVRESIFLRSSLRFPARQDSCASLRGDCSTLSHAAQPLLAQPRRSSDPDCLYSLARTSSAGEPLGHGLASEPATDTSLDSFSRTSFSRASLKISWNPWRHGLSSPESLPSEELPSQQLRVLAEDLPPAPSSSAPNSEREARKSFLALSKQVDSRSLSSDTIEL
ncbi:proline-rich transmembrane protein 3 [Python bivittatus]|uniref:Proline-rich transmembrane protein 3 n=1 Tax=Python bivittatus TaxID=176946 RepID=A0A9F2NVT9_PYTBI|nr:proline-rich transmembrane protein 3 [Python bivittatus]XP_025020632.1 proline-rich transmembrane protein 3 [Python bivittatus]XP_025020633.1 proline-rich transmembrane protein 3 [Python bivittatus]